MLEEVLDKIDRNEMNYRPVGFIEETSEAI
jgi:hypothetical protein